MAKKQELDSGLVTTGAPTEGGCVYTSFSDAYVAPTDALTPLGSSWESCGEISENGFEMSHDSSTTEHKGWHGTVVLTTVDDETFKYKLEFIEPNRGTCAKLYYGVDNVQVDSDGNVTRIDMKGNKNTPLPLVIDELQSNGSIRRTFIPKASVSSFDAVSHKKGDLLVYGLEFTAIEDNGSTGWQIVEKPTATASVSDSGK